MREKQARDNTGEGEYRSMRLQVSENTGEREYR